MIHPLALLFIVFWAVCVGYLIGRARKSPAPKPATYVPRLGELSYADKHEVRQFDRATGRAERVDHTA